MLVLTSRQTGASGSQTGPSASYLSPKAMRRGQREMTRWRRRRERMNMGSVGKPGSERSVCYEQKTADNKQTSGSWQRYLFGCAPIRLLCELHTWASGSSPESTVSFPSGLSAETMLATLKKEWLTAKTGMRKTTTQGMNCSTNTASADEPEGPKPKEADSKKAASIWLRLSFVQTSQKLHVLSVETWTSRPVKTLWYQHMQLLDGGFSTL